MVTLDLLRLVRGALGWFSSPLLTGRTPPKPLGDEPVRPCLNNGIPPTVYDVGASTNQYIPLKKIVTTPSAGISLSCRTLGPRGRHQGRTWQRGNCGRPIC